MIDMAKVRADFETGRVWSGDQNLCELDGIVIKKVGTTYSPHLLDRLAILRYVQSRGVTVCSDPAYIKRILDRLSCTVSLRAAGIPMPPTVITEQIDHAVEVVKTYGQAVLKPLYSTKARGMVVVSAGDDNLREQIIAYKTAGHKVLYIQKMLDLPDRDLGLTFLGGEYVGCYARVRSAESWNTTIHSGGKYRAYEPDASIIDLARRAQAPFQLDFTSVDIAETSEGPVVFEVSAFGGFRGLLEANKIDAAELYADYMIKKIKP